MKIKIFNVVLVLIACFGGIYCSIDAIKDNNLYGTLIDLSIIVTMLIPYILNKFLKHKINDTVICLYIVFIFFGHFLGSIVNLYDKIYCYDKIIHFTSGLLSSTLAFIILNKTDKNNNLTLKILFVISMSALVAFGWECIEYTCDMIFSKDAQNVLTTGVNDTMQDMLVAVLCSILVCISYAYEKTQNKKLLITKLVDNL